MSQFLVQNRVAFGRVFSNWGRIFLLGFVTTFTWAQQGQPPNSSAIFNLQPYLDATGVIATYTTNRTIDTSNPFFQSLGTNNRSCSTCHVASQAFSFSTAGAQLRFLTSRGHDPLFATVDGANCPTLPIEDRASHSLLLNHGLIRVAIDAPPTSTSQFSAQADYDPYGCASDSSSGQQVLSFYRRPLPSTNLSFLSTVMFDGRESAAHPLNSSSTFAANLNADLTQQALDATRGHAQATTDPSPDQLAAIVKFELGLYTAQVWDFRAGSLSAFGAQGGPLALSKQTYFPGTNDSLTPTMFSPTIFTLYQPWQNQSDRHFLPGSTARAAIAAGEQLFNTFPINITSVRGLNDNAALGKPAVIVGTCGTCHDAPGVGDHSLPLPLDIGTGHSRANETNPQIQSALAQLSFPDVPVYKVTGCTDPFTGETTIYTTDLGKAMQTGQCGDLNRIKGPILRGLAARPPYFHNGAAANLNELLNFYDQRFNMGLTEEQKTQLIAFLNSL